MVQFRMKALNQMQKPDDLDLLMKVTKRRGWIALTTLGVALAALIVWGFAGNIPAQVAGEGLMTSSNGISRIESQVEGFVTQVNIDEGQVIAAGDTVGSFESHDGNTTEIKAPFPGQVTAVLFDAGNIIEVGSTLYRLERSDLDDGGTVAFVFVPSTDVASIAPGMEVDLSLDAVPAAAFGVLRGTVDKVDSFPLDRAAIVTLLGDPDYADELLEDGEPVLITVRPTPDTSTASGFKWSTSEGPPFRIPSASRFTALITEGDQRPIDLVFGG